MEGVTTGSCEVYDHEILDLRNISEACYLAFLKGKGVPMRGCTRLEFDDRFTIIATASPQCMTTSYTWSLDNE